MNPNEILQLQPVTVLVLVEVSTDGHSFQFAFTFASASPPFSFGTARPSLRLLLPLPISHFRFHVPRTHALYLLYNSPTPFLFDITIYQTHHSAPSQPSRSLALLQIPLAPQRRLHVCPITAQPARLGTNRVLALFQRAIEALSHPSARPHSATPRITRRR